MSDYLRTRHFFRSFYFNFFIYYKMIIYHKFLHISFKFRHFYYPVELNTEDINVFLVHMRYWKIKKKMLIKSKKLLNKFKIYFFKEKHWKNCKKYFSEKNNSGKKIIKNFLG